MKMIALQMPSSTLVRNRTMNILHFWKNTFIPHVSAVPHTVKPALVDHLSTKTTCLRGPHFLFPLKMFFSLKHLLKEPVYKDHFLCFPWAVAIDRFYCTNLRAKKNLISFSKISQFIIMLTIPKLHRINQYYPYVKCTQNTIKHNIRKTSSRGI